MSDPTTRVAAAYLGRLVMAGRRPYYEVQEDLEAAGWRPNKKWQRTFGDKNTEVYSKQFGKVVVLALLDSWIYADNLRFRTMAQSPPGMDSDEFIDKTKRNLKYTEATPNKIDDAGKSIAKTVAEMMKGQKKKDWKAEFEWKGETGPEAYAEWVRDVEEEILTSCKAQYENAKAWYRAADKDPWMDRSRGPDYGWPTAHLTKVVLDWNMDAPWGIPRRQAQRLIRGILDRLVKQRKLVKDTNNPREPMWEWPG